MGIHYALAVTIVLLIGCETSFDPIKQNNRHYSVFGYLNASADTQYIRIEKLRDGQFASAPTELEAEVKLTNTTTGKTVTLRDSLFYFLGGTRSAHNFYTTADIVPTQSYRLDILGRETTSSDDVDIPEAFPEPVVVDSLQLVRTVEISGIDRLILAKVIYHITTKCLPGFPSGCSPMQNQISFSYLQDTVKAFNGDIQVEIRLGNDLLEIENDYPPRQGERSFIVDKVEFIVAAGTDDWPDFLSLDEEAAAVPGTASNIEGGVGFLGGTVTDTLVLINSPDEIDW